MSPLDLADLVKDPSKVADLNCVDIPVFLTQLSALQASMAVRLVTANQEAAAEPEDTLLPVEGAAERLGVSPDWLYRRTKKLPFVVRVGRHVRFSASGIDRYIKNRMGR